MRKTIAIALCIVLAYNILGLVVVFKAAQVRMKNEFLLSLSKDLSNRSLSVICYSSETKAGFTMIDEHELCYNGDMYDIVKEEQKDGKRIFYCISDKAETQLIANMEASVAKSMNQYGHHGTAQAFTFLLGFYMMPDSKINLYAPETQKLFTGSIFQSTTSPFIGLHFPPPKVG